MTVFERCMKFGLKDHLELILLILSSCRSTKELIQSNLPTLLECISNSTQKSVQYFVYEKLKDILSRNSSSSSKKILEPIILTLRVLAGCFTEEEFKRIDKNDKNQKAPRPHQLKSHPNLDILSLLRGQLQSMINPESPFTKRGGVSLGQVQKWLHENDIKTVKGNYFQKHAITRILGNPIYVKADMDVYTFLQSKGVKTNKQPGDYIGVNGILLYGNTKRVAREQYSTDG